MYNGNAVAVEAQTAANVGGAAGVANSGRSLESKYMMLMEKLQFGELMCVEKTASRWMGCFKLAAVILIVLRLCFQV